jgi:hypothetical protein
MFKLNEKIININNAYTAPDGTKYPNLRDPDIRSSLGIVEEADPVRADDRFYWNGNVDTPKALEDVDAVDENGDPLWVQTLDETQDPPVMVDTEERLVTRGLKSSWTAQVKHTAGTMLAPTDWMVTRKYERDVAIPSDVVTKRAAIVTECTRLETAIDACSNIEELIVVIGSQNWPN